MRDLLGIRPSEPESVILDRITVILDVCRFYVACTCLESPRFQEVAPIRTFLMTYAGIPVEA